MVDALKLGRRPWIKAPLDPREEREALAGCPGIGLTHGEELEAPELIEDLKPAWGPVLEVWEGHASDPEIRYAGSSGGALTAISLYCLEQANFHGVLNTQTRPEAPYLTETRLSVSRSDLLACTGSLYAPASPCERLHLIEDAPAPCLFVGKPCDVAAAQKTMTLRPRLKNRTGLTVAMFCAGTPSTQGTIEMIERMGIVSLDQVASVRYRGKGWPGEATVRSKSGKERRESYACSWSQLQKHRQWRCYICADHTGQFADIAVGDPWYREIGPGEAGESLILIRTERGREIFRAAREHGYLEVAPVAPVILPRSQPDLLRTRATLWPRLLVLRLFGAAVPRYRGMPTFRFWWLLLGFQAKFQSIYGTIARVFRKGLRQRISYSPWTRDPQHLQTDFLPVGNSRTHADKPRNRRPEM